MTRRGNAVAAYRNRIHAPAVCQRHERARRRARTTRDHPLATPEHSGRLRPRKQRHPSSRHTGSSRLAFSRRRRHRQRHKDRDDQRHRHRADDRQRASRHASHNPSCEAEYRNALLPAKACRNRCCSSSIGALVGERERAWLPLRARSSTLRRPTAGCSCSNGALVGVDATPSRRARADDRGPPQGLRSRSRGTEAGRHVKSARRSQSGSRHRGSRGVVRRREPFARSWLTPRRGARQRDRRDATPDPNAFAQAAQSQRTAGYGLTCSAQSVSRTPTRHNVRSLNARSCAVESRRRTVGGLEARHDAQGSAT